MPWAETSDLYGNVVTPNLDHGNESEKQAYY
jgi:hypothetical protein